MKKEIKILIERGQFREAFDFASRQPNTVTMRGSFVLIASEVSKNDKFPPAEKESLLKEVVKLLVFRKDFQRAKEVLLLVENLNWVPCWVRNLTGL